MHMLNVFAFIALNDRVRAEAQTLASSQQSSPSNGDKTKHVKNKCLCTAHGLFSLAFLYLEGVMS